MYMKIHCGNCGKDWEIYGRDNYENENARTCPHCFSKIDAQTWQHFIIPAFGDVLDAGRELLKDSYSGYGTPLFGISFLDDNMPLKDE